MVRKFDLELGYDEKPRFDNYFNSGNLEESIKYLSKFNEINIFVGANNSGKSRFVRELISKKHFDGTNDVHDLFEKVEQFNFAFNDFEGKVFKLNGNAINILNSYNEEAVKKNRLTINQDIEVNRIEFKNSLVDLKNEVESLAKKISIIDLLFHYVDYLKNEYHKNVFLREIRLNGKIPQHGDIVNLRVEKDSLKIKLYILREHFELIQKEGKNKIYIPALRTAHSLFAKVDDEISKIKDDFYLHTIKKNFKNIDDEVDVFTGQNLYKEIVNVRNSAKEKRKKFHEFELFLQKNFFDNKEVDIVAELNLSNNENLQNDGVIQVFIGGKSRELYNLGDGIQAIIILMYKIFLADENSIIFIDEPELNLHPGYQRLFLEQITSNPVLTKKKLTYVIVTHSNHFLDLTLEKDSISIYSFNSIGNGDNQKFVVKNVNAGDNEMLRALGVNNSSVFLANCSIWVEGISDRNFIKALLMAYCKDEEKRVYPREDIDFAFFEYAGSNLAHYNFKKSTSEYEEAKKLINSYALNNRILLYSDLDSGKETKHRNLKEIASELVGLEYYTTEPYRELENLITSQIWKKVLIEFCNKKKLNSKGDLNKVQEKIEKSLDEIEIEKYKSEYIGRFLSDLNIRELNKVWEEKEDGTLGTFKYKTKLSEIILKKVEKNEINWKDFESNKTLTQLAESVYSFIKS